MLNHPVKRLGFYLPFNVDNEIESSLYHPRILCTWDKVNGNHVTINCAALSLVPQINSLDLSDNMFASAVKPTKRRYSLEDKIKIIEYIKQIQQCIKVSLLSVFKEDQQRVYNIPLSCLYQWYHT